MQHGNVVADHFQPIDRKEKNRKRGLFIMVTIKKTVTTQSNGQHFLKAFFAGFFIIEVKNVPIARFSAKAQVLSVKP